MKAIAAKAAAYHGIKLAYQNASTLEEQLMAALENASTLPQRPESWRQRNIGRLARDLLASTMAFHYTVSLQVKHPAMDAQKIVSGIELVPSRAWSVGDLRATPKGTPLPGTQRESYCAFLLGDRDDGELAHFLRDNLAKLEHAAAFISELRRTGGSINFHISWSVGGRGEVFDVQLLANMARLGIDLGIDPLTSQ